MTQCTSSKDDQNSKKIVESFIRAKAATAEVNVQLNVVGVCVTDGLLIQLRDDYFLAA